MKKIILISMLTVCCLKLFSQETGTFTDSRDGKIYKTVKIGTQTWMAENLAFKAVSGCWTYNNNDGLVNSYGYLYSWETARKSCPAGWHLPSYGEWKELIDYLGGESIAGGKLKSTSWWESPNSGANNSSGFLALPGGYHNYDGSFSSDGTIGIWWSSTDHGENIGYAFNVSYDDETVFSSFYNGSTFAYSVRCVKD